MLTKKWIQKKHFFYSIIVWATILSLLEGGFRWWFFSQTRGLNTKLSIQGGTIQTDDSLLIFKNRPYYVDFSGKFQFNEESMKSAPGSFEMPKKNQEDYWIFLFGGSAMEGMGSNKDGEWLNITGQTDYRWDESISYYLQEYLREKLANKNVKVFNAAGSSYTIDQSFLRYKELAKKYQIDFVVSMDGQNDPPFLDPQQSSRQYMEQDWENRPSNKFPANLLLYLTQRSAFIYQIKQQYYKWKVDRKLSKINEDSFPSRKYWQGQKIETIKADQQNEGVKRAVDAYYSTLKTFSSHLDTNRQPHLLLLQPHLLFRKTGLAVGYERALLAYFNKHYNDPIKNSFLIKQQEIWKQENWGKDSTLVNLDFINTYTKEVFVDYCHFTPAINKFMATFIGERILKQISSEKHLVSFVDSTQR